MGDTELQQRLRILVAEDEPVIRALLSRMLQGLGYRADLVDNGAQAVDASQNHDYGLILMDIQMPEMDGFEASREILKSRPEKKKPVIIAVTALARDGIVQQCAQAGISDYLQKPVDAGGLRRMIEKWMPGVPQSPHTAEPGEARSSREMHERLGVLERETDPSFVKELLTMFLASAAAQLEKIQTAINEMDGKAIHAGAHALKGGSANIGAARLAFLCQKLENAGEEGRIDDARRFMDDLRSEFQHVQTVLAAYQSRLA